MALNVCSSTQPLKTQPKPPSPNTLSGRKFLVAILRSLKPKLFRVVESKVSPSLRGVNGTEEDDERLLLVSLPSYLEFGPAMRIHKNRLDQKPNNWFIICQHLIMISNWGFLNQLTTLAHSRSVGKLYSYNLISNNCWSKFSRRKQHSWKLNAVCGSYIYSLHNNDVFKIRASILMIDKSIQSDNDQHMQFSKIKFTMSPQTLVSKKILKFSEITSSSPLQWN